MIAIIASVWSSGGRSQICQNLLHKTIFLTIFPENHENEEHFLGMPFNPSGVWHLVLNKCKCTCILLQIAIKYMKQKNGLAQDLIFSQNNAVCSISHIANYGSPFGKCRLVRNWQYKNIYGRIMKHQHHPYILETNFIILLTVILYALQDSFIHGVKSLYSLIQFCHCALKSRKT